MASATHDPLSDVDVPVVSFRCYSSASISTRFGSRSYADWLSRVQYCTVGLVSIVLLDL